MRWTSLHHHSTFSYLDGYGTPEQHVERAEELGMGALALTEHGNVSSHVRLEQAGEKHGVKPIFGVELYTGAVDEASRSQFKWHLTVLAENTVGYRNLLRLVSRGWAEGFYYEPTVSGEMLAEHADGLIVLSGCSGSKAVCDLLGGKGVEAHDADMRAATRTVQRFRSLLGENFYLEAQAFPELERSRLTNQAWLEISAKTGVPIVATGDIHYPKPADNEQQILLHAIGRGGKDNSFEHQAQSWGYDVPLTAPLSDAAVIERMVGTGMPRRAAVASVQMAAEIADRCTVTLPKVDRLRFPLPQNARSSEELIWEWLRRGWRYRWPNNKYMQLHVKECHERIKYEMELIIQKDYQDYFLMLSDLVSYCKDNGCPVGPARGSAAASFVCYLLRITEVDPMPYPIMLFERFIDINRMDLPDIDLDFDDELREMARQRLVDVYGEEKVGNIGTFTRYRGKNAIDDVARVTGVPQWETKKVKSLLIERSGGDSRFDATITDTLDMFPQAQKVFDDNPELNRALPLEGMLRGMGVHAAGLVVANGPLTDYVAVYSRYDKKNEVTRQIVSVDKYDAEHLGIMKIDALSLKTMGMIRLALEKIGMSLEDLYKIPMDDPATLEGFRTNDVTGVFQFDGRATRSVCSEVKPDSFLEIADVNALSRPGPLHSGSTADYISVKWGRMEPVHLHPVVDRLTKDTKFQIIYQEQILQLVREVGGFPWTHASAIRRIISQKKGEAAFNEMEGMFLEGALRLHQIPQETAIAIWKKLVTAGTYAFNIAHSISYSMLAFWTMWLKVHHPQAFYYACLRKYEDGAKNGPTAHKLTYIMRDAVDHKISVRAPVLNESAVDWETLGNDAVMAGYMQVPGIGDKLGAIIIQDQQANGPFAGWGELQRVKGFGPAKMKMVQDFAESADPFKIDLLRTTINDVRLMIMQGGMGKVPRPTHRSAEVPYNAEKMQVVWLGTVKQRNLRDMFEEHRSRTGDELRPQDVKDPHLKESMVLYCEDETGDLNVKIDRWKYPHFSEALWGLRPQEDLVLVQGIKRGSFGRQIAVQRLWVIDPMPQPDSPEED